MAKRRIRSRLKVCKEIWAELKKSRGVRQMSALYALLLGCYTIATYIWPQLSEIVKNAPKLNTVLSWRSWIIVALVLMIVFIIDGAYRVKRRKLKDQAHLHRTERQRWETK